MYLVLLHWPNRPEILSKTTIISKSRTSADVNIKYIYISLLKLIYTNIQNMNHISISIFMPQFYRIYSNTIRCIRLRDLFQIILYNEYVIEAIVFIMYIK